MVNKDTVIAILILIFSISGGYFFIKDRGIVPSNTRETYEQAVEETIEFVSILDRIHPDKIKVMSSETAEWPNGCLGLPMIDEICTEALVPGYKITLDADGEIMIFRINKDGSSIRRDLAAEKIIKRGSPRAGLPFV
ncbi:MAG: hypothetical protein AAB641_00180 [Patescibacteria group bacterium]